MKITSYSTDVDLERQKGRKKEEAGGDEHYNDAKSGILQKLGHVY